ncbi:MAG: ABC transporter ATP-binding protein [Dehalococcoidia bacterium]|nr:ABC transporter ATP-binding protein [Dehalococcoidia bacterium]
MTTLVADDRRTDRSAMPAPVEFQRVRVRLGGSAVLDGASLELRAGELLGIIGPNGAGKSTLVRAATGIVPLEEGEVLIEGRALRSYSSQALARRVAVVQQLPEAPPTMTVAELVTLGRTPHLGFLTRESSRDRAIVAEAMERAGCVALAERALGTLSGGQRRRAFVARALAQEPAILLLDEPTANLDPHAQAELCLLLRSLVHDGVAVLAVVHDLTLAAAYCDRLVLLDSGRVVASGRPAEVLTEPRLRDTYGVLVSVITHPDTGLPVVTPARGAITAQRAEDVDG